MRLKHKYSCDFEFQRYEWYDFSDFFFIPKAPDVTFSSDKVNELLLEDADFMKLMDV